MIWNISETTFAVHFGHLKPEGLSATVSSVRVLRVPPGRLQTGSESLLLLRKEPVLASAVKQRIAIWTWSQNREVSLWLNIHNDFKEYGKITVGYSRIRTWIVRWETSTIPKRVHLPTSIEFLFHEMKYLVIDRFQINDNTLFNWRLISTLKNN